MAVYRYQAKRLDGKLVNGQIEALDETDARNKIRGQQLIPLKLAVGTQAQTQAKAAKSGPGLFDSLLVPKVKAKDLQVFTRQLATLVNAGIPVVDALGTLATGSAAPLVRTSVGQVKLSIESGKRLGDAMAQFPNVFDRFYVNMVRAGEEAGILDDILLRMATYIDKAEKIKSQVKGAMFYPAAILVVSILIIVGMLVYIIPRFQDLFKNSQQEPPALTQAVVGLSHFFVANWYFIIAALIMTPIFISYYYSTPVGRANLDAILIRSPVFGDLILKSSVARFSRTLSTLLKSGVRVIDALDIAAKTSGNHVIEVTLGKCKESVTAGKQLAMPLSKEKLVPHMVAQMVLIGEQSGTLDTMLEKVADFYEDEVDNAIKAMTSLIEPILMVFLGGIIAIMVLAMYLPVFNMAGMAGV